MIKFGELLNASWNLYKNEGGVAMYSRDSFEGPDTYKRVMYLSCDVSLLIRTLAKL